MLNQPIPQKAQPAARHASAKAGSLENMSRTKTGVAVVTDAGTKAAGAGVRPGSPGEPSHLLQPVQG